MQDKNFKLEKMRYQNNSLSYTLGMLGIIFSVLAAFVGLNSYRPTVGVILKILFNIVILLGGFLAIEKAKNYRKEYSIFLVVIGVICALRILWVPLQLIQYSSLAKETLLNPSNYKGGNLIASAQDTINNCKKYLAEVAFPAKYENGKFLYSSTGWLFNDGVFRGIMMVVELVLASACFVASGLVGYKKSVALESYLADHK